MDLQTLKAIKLIKKHVWIRKYLTQICYLFIIGGVFVYIFYAVVKNNEKFKLVAQYGADPEKYKTEKIMVNPRIKYLHSDNKLYDIVAKKAVHKDEEEVVLYDVKATGEVGSITAGELNVSDNGDHLVFTKNPVLILNKDVSTNQKK